MTSNQAYTPFKLRNKSTSTSISLKSLKNFRLTKTIEKSLKSGSKEYCGTISNSQGLLIVEKLHGKEFKVSKAYMKYCFGKVRAKTKNSDMYIQANDNGAKLFNL